MRKRSPKRPRSRSPVYHSPAREKPSSVHKSPKYRTLPSTVSHSPKPSPSRSPAPVSPIKEKSSSRTRSSKQGKPRSSVSRSPEKVNLSNLAKSPVSGRSNSPKARSPSPRSKRLKSGKDERDVEKSSEREHDKNYGRNGDRATHKERDYDRTLPILRSDKRQGRDAIDNGFSKWRRRRSDSPSDGRQRGQHRSRSPSTTDDRARDERDYPRTSEQRNDEIVEQRLKSFLGQLLTERGILERIVYKHKNQHRRCSYFQYVLKVRRDLNLLKSVNLEEILDASFLVINGNKPKQKVQLLESLKRRRCDGGKYNFLERLLGAARLLSQMVEPLLRAAMEISTLLAQSFFMKFSLTTLAVLARIRVLVQQVLVDAVHVYNYVSSLSQREHTIKLNQVGFEVFREYYPRKVEATVTLDCIWQVDKNVLVERTVESESKSQEKDDQEDVLIKPSNIQYDDIEAFLGDESDPMDVELVSAEPSTGEESTVNHLEKQVQNDSHSAGSSCLSLVSNESETCGEKLVEDGAGSSCLSLVSNESETCGEKLMEDGAFTASCSAAPFVEPMKHKSPTKKKVAYLSVNPKRTPSTVNQSEVHLSGTWKSGDQC